MGSGFCKDNGVSHVILEKNFLIVQELFIYFHLYNSMVNITNLEIAPMPLPPLTTIHCFPSVSMPRFQTGSHGPTNRLNVWRVIFDIFNESFRSSGFNLTVCPSLVKKCQVRATNQTEIYEMLWADGLNEAWFFFCPSIY